MYAVDNFPPVSELALMQFLHIQKEPVILGLEEDPYYQKRYGCEPLICFEERVNIWKHILPADSIMFAVPEFTLSYDVLSQRVGVYRNSKIFHVGLETCDKKKQKLEKRRACRGKYLTFLPLVGLC